MDGCERARCYPLVYIHHSREPAASRHEALFTTRRVDGASIRDAVTTRRPVNPGRNATAICESPAMHSDTFIPLTPPVSKTPAQPRFLLSKRQAPQSQTQSQKQRQTQTPTPRQVGPQQFVSTPRFNVSAAPVSSRATASHHPPVFSTPAPPSSARQWNTQKGTQYDSLDDAIDSSPVSSAAREDDENQDRHRCLNKSIEIDSPSASASRSSLGQDDRPIKRRRVSLSPEIDASTDQEEYDEDRMEVDDAQPTEEDVIATRSPSSLAESDSGSNESGSPSTTEPSTRHPTFHKAPRFKAAEMAEGAQRGLLPDAFSPQRRGARYVPGGLAAELREWLVQVKGASEYDRPATPNVEAMVDEAKGGNGVWLVATHEKHVDDRQQERDLAKVILAGDGRMAGLGGKNIVSEGTTVSLHQPMWDINLCDLGHCTVACDWESVE